MRALIYRECRVILHCYYRTGLFYLLTLYLLTAPPRGKFQFTWNPYNLALTGSYLVVYPLLLTLAPRLGQTHFRLTSLRTRSLQHDLPKQPNLQQIYRHHLNPIASRSRILQNSRDSDASMTSKLQFLIQGGLLLLAIPIVVGLVIRKLIRQRW